MRKELDPFPLAFIIYIFVINQFSLKSIAIRGMSGLFFMPHFLHLSKVYEFFCQKNNAVITSSNSKKSNLKKKEIIKDI